jgi:eukaryotic-like serine/threonine-protein kinase
VGARSFGRYELLDLLGRGGMGEVYRAHDTATERIVAIKLLPADLAGDSTFERRFRREARIAAGLNDPHVVPIHNYGEVDGQLYVDMRLIEGSDLQALLADGGGRLSAARAVAIIEQVAGALDSAHREGLVHRDVKPSNILITGRDFAYLIDFGIARAANDTAVTKTGQTIGTFAYMAPERFSGTIDARADVYALACVLHECLTGERPYPGDSLEQQVAGHLTVPPPQPSGSHPDISSAFDAVIAKGMAKDPDDRYQTASELADAARAALTSPRPKSASGRATQPPPPRAPRPRAPGDATTPVPRRLLDEQRHDRELQLRAGKARRRLIPTIVGAAVLAAVAIVAIVIVAVSKNEPQGATASTTPSVTADGSTPATEPPLGGSLPPFQAPANLGANCQYPASQEKAANPVKPPRTGKVPTEPATVSASMVTNQGHIGLLLNNAQSPCTVNSFASLIGQRFFNDTQCHRLTTSPALSVLQCGDPTGTGTGGPGYQFGNEYPTDQYPPNDPKLRQPVIYPRGTLAMAHSRVPNSNGSQFFMVFRDSALPPDYTVFGKIQDDGLATLDKIAQGGVAGGGQDGKPVNEVTVKSVRLD